MLFLLTMWLWRVLHWISHGTVRVFSIDTHMDMDTWAWTVMDIDMDMDMDTSWKQCIGFCTWTHGMIERGKSWQLLYQRV